MEDRVMPVLVTLIFTALVGCGVYAVWFHATHHCAKSHAEWRERSCSSNYIADQYYGETCTEAHWETVCDYYEKDK